jgi:hypothetical protein
LTLGQEELLQELKKTAEEVHVDNIIKIVKGHIISGVTGLFTTQVSRKYLENLPETKDDEAYWTCQPTTDDALNALKDAYRDINVQWLVCTEYVFDLLRRCAGDHIQDFNQRFLQVTSNNSMLGVARGNSFQIYAPKILAEGRSLPCRKLENGAVETQMVFAPSKLVKLRSTDVRQVMKSCVDEGTLYDICGSLAGIDGLKRTVPNRVFAVHVHAQAATPDRLQCCRGHLRGLSSPR